MASKLKNIPFINPQHRGVWKCRKKRKIKKSFIASIGSGYPLPYFAPQNACWEVSQTLEKGKEK
jgi:hypothetical protein